ncbi:serine/threonine-protein kinase [Sulfurisoma sediminicola]|uniref:Serine/threonine protein kinase n=1 Tax=Sulfurisoma sediminicola TaxID=1381557 RepID=A0A497XLJ3_9PROT|nr:serine/threonine-protein kinase [Sulfurisoma sediminicola]RLJ68175.1 serine/threonine protein kinase [Sulfurisoma sediminicola]
MASDPSQDETIPTTPRGARVDFDLDGTFTVAPALPFAGDAPSNPPTASHIALPLGFALHEYTIEALLGAGGFGISYRARDNNLQCQVALKEYLPNDLAVRADGQSVLPRSDADTEAYRLGLERFLAEARVLAGFRHPNIVRVTRFFEANRTAYMVMDYEQGESLREWLHGHSPVDEAALKRMFLPLLDGLAIVHDAGVVHRDIKPANIYVRDGDGSLVLLDFGAARQTTGVPSRSLTSIVTPGYAPFEQYHTRGAQGPWTDLYALAGVLYWLVTGQKPLEAPSRVKDDIMMPAAAAAAGRFSPAFLAAIDWALRVDEVARPCNVAEFRRALLGEAPVPEPAATASSAPARSSAKGGKGSKGKLAAIGAVAVLALLGLFALTRSVPTLAPPAHTPVAQAPAAETQTTVAPPAAVSAPAKPSAAARVAPSSTVRTQKPPPAQQQPSKPQDPAGPVATLVFEIVPPGEHGVVLVDGKTVGSAPPLKELKLATGKHKVEIRGDKLPRVYHFWVELEPNERRKLWAKFTNEL